jgi:hypothetical protein
MESRAHYSDRSFFTSKRQVCAMAPAEGVSMPKRETLALSPVFVVPSVFCAIAAPVSPKAEPSATPVADAYVHSPAWSDRKTAGLVRIRL